MLPVPENLQARVGWIWMGPRASSQDSLKLWRPVWDFLTIVLVVVDALVLPLLLAWPELSYSGSFWSGYYEARILKRLNLRTRDAVSPNRLL